MGENVRSACAGVEVRGGISTSARRSRSKTDAAARRPAKLRRRSLRPCVSITIKAGLDWAWRSPRGGGESAPLLPARSALTRNQDVQVQTRGPIASFAKRTTVRHDDAKPHRSEAASRARRGGAAAASVRPLLWGDSPRPDVPAPTPPAFRSRSAWRGGQRSRPGEPGRGPPRARTR